MRHSLLLISPSSPFSAVDGKRQRTLALILAASQKYDVDILILENPPVDKLNPPLYVPGLQIFYLPQIEDGFWIKKFGLSYFPNSTNLHNIAEFLKIKSYSKILCRYAIAAKNLPNNTFFIIDVDDDFNELMKSKISHSIGFLKKIRFLQIYFINKFYYSRILKRANKLIWVKQQNGEKEGIVLPNLPFQLLFEKNDIELKPPVNHKILFIGKLSYSPNSEGIRWFLENVWIKLRVNLPHIKLSVISSLRPDPDLEQLIFVTPGVTLEVNVSNLPSLYHSHSLCIVPVFFGGGSNVKLAEALWMGRKVVSSPFGVRGFEKWIVSNLVHVAIGAEEWDLCIRKLLAESWDENEFFEVRESFSLSDWNLRLLRILNDD